MQESAANGDGLRRVDRANLALSGPDLRWSCDREWLDFESTADIEPVGGVIGQDDAMEALRFGLESSSAGQNIFVRGLTGTGRMTLVRQLLGEIRPDCRPIHDRCYVHNFSQPDRPRLLTLPHGEGLRFRARIDQLIEFIRHDLGPGLASEAVRARRARLDRRAQDQMRQLGQPFDRELEEAKLTLVPVQMGQTVQPVILPVVDGQPTPIENYQQLRAEGKVANGEAERVLASIEELQKRFQEVSEKIREIQDRHREAVEQLYVSEARSLLGRFVAVIEGEFPQEAVRSFLGELIDDLIGRRLQTLKEDQDFTHLYRVNVVASHAADEQCPIIIENAPTLPNLLGTIEREFVAGIVRSDHTMIRAGSLLRADGGFLIVEARDLLAEPGAWKVLVRTLRTGLLEIVPSELAAFWAGPSLKPEPVDVQVKVILLGDPELHVLLDAYDPDFPHLFKVLADFDTSIERDRQGVNYYAGVLARIATEEGLPPFSRNAVAALAEHGARIAARRQRLTTRFGRLADLAREAAFLARKEGSGQVRGDDVLRAVQRTRRRADLPARRFRQLVAEGTIRVRVAGEAVGQLNGLAVTHAGPLTYGFPTRITATIGPGSAGAINIEREAQLSGAIHTKGFYILGGLLRHLLHTRHPLAFSASVAFEQSYGGIDGDSASGAEACCLISALTGVPLRQDLALTGAIDQFGQILPVGAVTEKVEGFYDVCQDLGLTGTQGVIVPRANAGDLMLRADLVAACRRGEFQVLAVDTIQEALELLTGRMAGKRGDDDGYPEDTLLGRAERRAYDYWKLATVGARHGDAGVRDA